MNSFALFCYRALCVCVCVCLCAYIYIYIHKYICIYIHIHIRISPSVSRGLSGAFSLVCVCACVCVCVCVFPTLLDSVLRLCLLPTSTFFATHTPFPTPSLCTTHIQAGCASNVSASRAADTGHSGKGGRDASGCGGTGDADDVGAAAGRQSAGEERREADSSSADSGLSKGKDPVRDIDV